MTEELDDVPLLEETPENDSVTPASPGCCARVRRVITVEPTVALYFLAAVSYFPTYQQYIYKQISDENGFTPSPYQNCSANVNVSQSDLEKKVQSLSSQFMLISTLVGLIPSAFATMFLGSYSDYRGRKLPLVTPFIGGCVRNFVVEIIIYFRLNIYWFLLPTALESLSGGLMTILMAGFAYTADISTLQTRTIRIFILEAMIMLCVAVTSLATGYLIRDVGFAYTFLSQFVIFVIGLVFTLFYLEETVTVRDTSLVSLTHLKEGIGLYFRAAEGGRRWKLLTMLIIILLTVGVDLGGATVSTFFLLGWPACFTSISLGIYTAVTYLSGAVLSSLSVKALGRMLVDTAFPVIGSIVSMIYQMLFGLAFSRLFIYIAPFVGFAKLLIVPFARGASSKLVDAHEQGAMFAMIALIEQLAGFLGTAILSLVYYQSVYLFRGVVYFFATGLMAIALILSLVVHFGMKREKRTIAHVEHD